MLYELRYDAEGKPNELKPLPFGRFDLEKHLEDLLAAQLTSVLFEDNEMMPIFQERNRQPEADIYALNEEGDLVIFELKRGTAQDGALHQALRYCETAAHWSFDELQRKYTKYIQTKRRDEMEETDRCLLAAHQENFGLDCPLDKSAFNRRQHLRIVGTAGDDRLIRNVDYWRSQGISVSFMPYRVYEIEGKSYFEFFSQPYDRHANPSDIKGVIFDSDKTYREYALEYMLEQNRVAAFGGSKDAVNCLRKGDTVFLYEKVRGIIAAGRITSDKKEDVERDALYCDVIWLIGKPGAGEGGRAMSAREIKQELNRNFFWARTVKVPYLSVEETKTLLEALRRVLGETDE